MKDFTAEQAREILDGTYKEELHTVLMDIKKKAEEGKYDLHITNSLNNIIISELEKRGFKVTNHSSITIQKENLYHSISWR